MPWRERGLRRQVERRSGAGGQSRCGLAEKSLLAGKVADREVDHVLVDPQPSHLAHLVQADPGRALRARLNENDPRAPVRRCVSDDLFDIGAVRPSSGRLVLHVEDQRSLLGLDSAEYDIGRRIRGRERVKQVLLSLVVSIFN